MKRRCENCDFFYVDDRLKSKVNGECRRHAPTETHLCFPPTRSDSWCGEHKNKDGGFWG